MLCAATFAFIAMTACNNGVEPKETVEENIEKNTKIVTEYSADFEKITLEEYLKAKKNISKCTQSPEREIPQKLKEEIIEEIFNKVLGDEGREYALMVDTLINIYGYYPALGAIVADASKADAWGMQRGWLFDTTGAILGGGFSVIGMAVRVDGLIASLGISSSGFPSTPDTLFLMTPTHDGRRMNIVHTSRFDTDSAVNTITEWLPSSMFWGPDSSLYISGNPRTNDGSYYDTRHEVFYRLKLSNPCAPKSRPDDMRGETDQIKR